MILWAIAFLLSFFTTNTPLYVFSFGDSYTTTAFNPLNTSAAPTAQQPLGNPAYPGNPTAPGPNWLGILIKEMSPRNTLCYNFARYGATVNQSVSNYSYMIPDMSFQVNSMFLSNLGDSEDALVKDDDDDERTRKRSANEQILSHDGTSWAYDHGRRWAQEGLDPQPPSNNHKRATDPPAYNQSAAGPHAGQFANIPWRSYNSIATLFVGINDLKLTYGPNPNHRTYTLSEESGNMDIVLDSYMSLFETLYEAGMRRFVVLTVPPLERTPQVIEDLDNAEVVVPLVERYNQRVRGGVAEFAARRGDVGVRVVETAAVFNRILDDPRRYGSKDNVCSDRDGVTCLWWDQVHPGKAIQRELATPVWEAFRELGFYSGWWGRFAR